MVAASAPIIRVHLPVELRAVALLAKVAGKWPDVEETDEGKEFANTILQWGSGQAPFVICLQSKACFG